MKKKKSMLVLAMISLFTAMTLFFSGLSDVVGKPNKPDPMEPVMAMLDEIYNIVLDTNIKVGEIRVPAPVEKTGQNSCWDPEGSPISIDCEGTRQDGESQRGVAWPDPRFTDNHDGTVTDNLTGLIWLKNANCFGRRLWQSAMDDCNSLANGDCGLSDGSSPGDWHLPNVKELHSLVDYGMSQPAFPSGHPFENVQSYDYWSSTMITGNTGGAGWSVSFNQGDVNSTCTSESCANTAYVWPVRGGN